MPALCNLDSVLLPHFRGLASSHSPVAKLQPIYTSGKKYGFHLFSTLHLYMNIMIRERDNCVEVTQHSHLRSESKLTSNCCYYSVVNKQQKLFVNFKQQCPSLSWFVYRFSWLNNGKVTANEY